MNKRLAGDESEDVAFPKVQFPTKEKCSLCHRISDDSFDSFGQMARNSRLPLTTRQLIHWVKVKIGKSFIVWLASSTFSSYTGVIWMLTTAVTVIGLWIYKHYRVKVDGVDFLSFFRYINWPHWTKVHSKAQLSQVLSSIVIARHYIWRGRKPKCLIYIYIAR